MAYVLKKNEDKLSLYSTPDFEGYKFNPKKEKTLISVNKVVVVNPVLVDNILSIKFQDKHLDIFFENYCKDWQNLFLTILFCLEVRL